MPTDIHFVGVEKPLKLRDDYDTVTAQLAGHDPGRFTRRGGGRSVTVYRFGIAYIEDIGEADGASVPRHDT